MELGRDPSMEVLAIAIAVFAAFFAGTAEEPMSIIPIDALALAVSYGAMLPSAQTQVTIDCLRESTSIFIGALLVASTIYAIGMVVYISS
jgi:hypothetical protein